MPKTDSQHAPLGEPGKRTGEGSKSILPHLQRQVQAQIKPPKAPKGQKPGEPPTPSELPESDLP